MGGVGQIAPPISHHLIAQMPALALGKLSGGRRRERLQMQLRLGLFYSDGEHTV